MVQYEILVEGRVQRVGYHNFAKRYAERCEIKGWVKNTPNGKVQLMGQLYVYIHALSFLADFAESAEFYGLFYLEHPRNPHENIIK